MKTIEWPRQRSKKPAQLISGPTNEPISQRPTRSRYETLGFHGNDKVPVKNLFGFWISKRFTKPKYYKLLCCCCVFSSIGFFLVSGFHGNVWCFRLQNFFGDLPFQAFIQNVSCAHCVEPKLNSSDWYSNALNWPKDLCCSKIPITHQQPTLAYSQAYVTQN